MLMSPLNGVNKELTGRVSLCADRAGGVMAAVSVCNYTLSRCILAAVVGEQAAQPRTRQGGGRREKEGGGKNALTSCASSMLPGLCIPPSERWLCWAGLRLGDRLAVAELRMGCSRLPSPFFPFKTW